MKVHPFAIEFSVLSESDILPSFHEILAKVREKQKVNLFSGQFLTDMATAYTEGAANAIRHALELKKRGKVDCQFKLLPKHVEIRIFDHGRGFSLNSVLTPRFKSLSEKGRGVFMMRQLMDTVEYKRGKRRNTLLLKRFLIGTDRESKDLDLLYEISDAVLQSSDVESVYRVILDKAVEVFGVERASILMFDGSSKKLKVVASRGMTPKLKKEIQVYPGEGISGYVFLHSKPCLIEDMERNKAGWKRRKRYKSRSFISAPMICSPMRLGQESVGVINMTDRIDGRPFTKKDLRLLTTIANQAAAYIHICQLHSKAKDAEVFRKELDIARDIQQSYLPSDPPKVKGLDISGWLKTAQSVGGDYYDFILPDSDNFFAVVADVSGHNVAAALTMANFRSQLKALLFKEKDPGRILTLLNASLHEDLIRNDQFISMVLVRFFHGRKQVEMANAGHRLPLLIQNSKVQCPVSFQEGGAVLGAFRDESFKTVSVDLKTSETLILYTDGITETTNAKGLRLGIDRLKRFFEKNSNKNASEMMKGLKSEVEDFRKGFPITDDVTAVAIRVL